MGQAEYASIHIDEDFYEQVVIEHLRDDLGYEELYGPDVRRTTDEYRDVFLPDVLPAALARINPNLPREAIQEAILKMSNVEGGTLEQRNETFNDYLQSGVEVRYFDGQEELDEIVYLLDFDNPDNNDFHVVNQWTFVEYSEKRPDVIAFVNGMPLVMFELKSPSREEVDASDAYLQLRNYMHHIPSMFVPNVFCVMSDMAETRVGTITADEDRFTPWKSVDGDYSDTKNAGFKTMLHGMMEKARLLDIIKNFVVFNDIGDKVIKILAAYHQYFGVRKAIERAVEAVAGDGKIGVFWHTQGSGKSYSMVFLAQKIRRKFAGSPTIVVLTDRDELNRQISDTFENCGLLGKTKASQFIASSGTDLVKKLQGNPSFVFTLIQKFNLPKEPPIYPDHDILILSDEAHRSQYGIFADNMMHLLPTASRIGFTGTPLLADDHITERTFGGYLSVYDFKRAVEDGATVPLYYENRADKIAQLDKPEITGRILDAIEAADLDPSQEEKLEREFAKEIHILTADERLRSIAKDFVEHYSDLWTSGKAMFVCLNKVTCVRMYNYVQEYWRAKIRELEARQGTATQQEAQELARKLAWMKETEMAVVISQEQNEVQTFKKWGLDILPHRAKMEKRELDKEFKDSKNPFRVVFVCAMWLTGFDVKCLSCLYLDKPLKAHTLMQTIARANRVSEGKSNGLIVDYIGIVKALRKALADYTVSKNSPAGIDPTVDKTELIQRIRTVIGKTDGFLAEHGFRLQELVDAQDFEKMGLVQDAVNAMCETLETKKTFQTYASELARLFRYADRDDVDDAVRARKNAILAIYEGLQQKRKHADNTDLMVQINGIVNEYIHVEKPDQEAVPSRQFDISKIDFDLLSREFAHTRRKNLLLRDLDELVNQQLAKMLFANPQRIDYYDRYQEIIDAYNAEQNRATIEKTFMDLMELASSLDTEQQRYVREGFSSDEELSVYDLLFSENLTKQEIETIKKVSVDLLTKIKQQIAKLDHWTDKQETKAIVDNLIRNTLWQELPNSYDVSDIQTYQKKIYEYVYMRYPEVA